MAERELMVEMVWVFGAIADQDSMPPRQVQRYVHEETEGVAMLS